MENQLTYTVIGADDLASCLKGLPLKFSKKVMVSSLRKGAQKIKSAIAKRVPGGPTPIIETLS